MAIDRLRPSLSSFIISKFVNASSQLQMVVMIVTTTLSIGIIFSSSFLVHLTCSLISSENIMWSNGSTVVLAPVPSPIVIISGTPSYVAISEQFCA